MTPLSPSSLSPKDAPGPQDAAATRAMGIRGLTTLLADLAPKCITESSISQYFGRKVAIDASMSIYQFLIAVRSDGNVLTNEAGETTSHLMGMFYRTVRMLENGIKPVYVFDGKPPELKAKELAKRSEKRAVATKDLEEATETGTTEDVEKFSRRLVKVTKTHNDECKRLLALMGVPFVEAPGEAEAQCAAMARAGLVYAAGSEDMDTLTFGTPVLLRHLTFSEAKRLPISEICLEAALQHLEIDMAQFIDLCILLGCDYCPSIKGIGPKKAMALIREYRCIEAIVEALNDPKYTLPENWLFREARAAFCKPDVCDPATLNIKWTLPDEEGLVQFMVHEKSFDESRIRNNVRKIVDSRSKASQGRLDSFFGVASPSSAASSNEKRSSIPAANRQTGKRVATGKRARS